MNKKLGVLLTVGACVVSTLPVTAGAEGLEMSDTEKKLIDYIQGSITYTEAFDHISSLKGDSKSFYEKVLEIDRKTTELKDTFTSNSLEVKEKQEKLKIINSELNKLLSVSDLSILEKSEVAGVLHKEAKAYSLLVDFLTVEEVEGVPENNYYILKSYTTREKAQEYNSILEIFGLQVEDTANLTFTPSTYIQDKEKIIQVKGVLDSTKYTDSTTKVEITLGEVTKEAEIIKTDKGLEFEVLLGNRFDITYDINAYNLGQLKATITEEGNSEEVVYAPFDMVVTSDVSNYTPSAYLDLIALGLDTQEALSLVEQSNEYIKQNIETVKSTEDITKDVTSGITTVVEEDTVTSKGKNIVSILTDTIVQTTKSIVEKQEEKEKLIEQRTDETEELVAEVEETLEEMDKDIEEMDLHSLITKEKELPEVEVELLPDKDPSILTDSEETKLLEEELKQEDLTVKHLHESYSKNKFLLLEKNEIIEHKGKSTIDLKEKMTRGAVSDIFGNILKHSNVKVSPYDVSNFSDTIEKNQIKVVETVLGSGIMKPVTLEGNLVVEDDLSNVFHTQGVVSRVDMAVYLKRLLDIYGYDTTEINHEATYTDLQGVDLTEEQQHALALTQSLGIFHGDNGKFKPNNEITKEQTVKVIYNTLALIGEI